MDIEQVLRPNPVELTLAFPRWRTVLATVVTLVMLAAPIAYGVYLAPGGYARVLLGVILVPSLVFAAFVIRSAVVRLNGPPPALTTEGIRLRARPWHKRLVDVSWSRATMMWIDYVGRQPVLNVVPSGRMGRRAPRPDAAIRPYLIPLPPTVRPDTVRDEVRTLSDETADVLDRGFDHDGGASDRPRPAPPGDPGAVVAGGAPVRDLAVRRRGRPSAAAVRPAAVEPAVVARHERRGPAARSVQGRHRRRGYAGERAARNVH